MERFLFLLKGVLYFLKTAQRMKKNANRERLHFQALYYPQQLISSFKPIIVSEVLTNVDECVKKIRLKLILIFKACCEKTHTSRASDLIYSKLKSIMD